MDSMTNQENVMEFNVTQISPELASELLSRNINNRPLSRLWVHRLSDAMRAGEWRENGETIKIAVDGSLIDGQHRLAAIIKSGKTISSAIISGMPNDVFPTLDAGKRRSASDTFAIDDYKNTFLLAATTRAIKNIKAITWNTNYTTVQLRRIVDEYPNIHAWASRATAIRPRWLAPSCIIAIVTMSEKKHGTERCEYFMSKLAEGSGLPNSSPIWMLRERITQSRGGHTRLSPRALAALSIKAWNFYVNNRSIGLLRFNQDEQFPVLL